MASYKRFPAILVPYHDLYPSIITTTNQPRPRVVLQSLSGYPDGVIAPHALLRYQPAYRDIQGTGNCFNSLYVLLLSIAAGLCPDKYCAGFCNHVFARFSWKKYGGNLYIMPRAGNNPLCNNFPLRHYISLCLCTEYGYHQNYQLALYYYFRRAGPAYSGMALPH